MAPVRAEPLPRLARAGTSYKIGERLWLSLREEAREREGEAFDLKVFHRKALDLGGVPLDTLRSAVLDEL